MARRRRSKVIRNFTEKTALDTVTKAGERISELEAENARLREVLKQCRDFFDNSPPDVPNEWAAIREVVREALKK